MSLDYEYILPPRLTRVVELYSGRESRTADFLVQLRKLAAEGDPPVAEGLVKVGKRRFELMRSLVENQRPVVVPYRLKTSCPVALVRRVTVL